MEDYRRILNLLDDPKLVHQVPQHGCILIENIPAPYPVTYYPIGSRATYKDVALILTLAPISAVVELYKAITSTFVASKFEELLLKVVNTEVRYSPRTDVNLPGYVLAQLELKSDAEKVAAYTKSKLAREDNFDELVQYHMDTKYPHLASYATNLLASPISATDHARQLLHMAEDEDKISLYRQIKLTRPYNEFEVKFVQLMEANCIHLIRMMKRPKPSNLPNLSLDLLPIKPKLLY